MRCMRPSPSSDAHARTPRALGLTMGIIFSKRSRAHGR